MKRLTIFSILLTFVAGTCVAQERIPVIFDTDFAMPPTDDALALMLALQSPELEILGVTTVAGNYSLERATTDVLRMLEIAEQPDIPVFRGADMPLVHRKSKYAEQNYGWWYSDEPSPEPPGGFAKKQAESQSAVSFILNTVRARPREVTILAIGPLTNVAQAIRSDADFVHKVRRLVIMGGAIAALPDGGGNITPNAEYNFWVDPEAAQIVLRSGIPIELSPLNVSRQSALTLASFEKMTAAYTPLTRLLIDTMGPRFADEPDKTWFMYDQIAVAALIQPDLVKTKELYVDVNVDHGISYGVSVGGPKIWPGAEGAHLMNVQYELDWPRFIEMFVERVSAPLPSAAH